MSLNRPVSEFLVKPERVDKALEVFKKAIVTLGQETVLEVVADLGFDDRFSYEASDHSSARYAMDMTDVQFCALAAGLAAVIESGGKRTLDAG